MFQIASTLPPQPTADLGKTYDAVIVGSGAAGGMAAHVLTSHGMNVLMLEAGKQRNLTKELHSMEWPYNHPRRGDMPADSHALTMNEYNVRPRPYAKGMRYNHVYSYVQGWGGSDYSKNIVVEEKDHPTTGTPYAWVRARILGGKTTIWGRLALRLSDYDFKAASRDGFGENWPISYADIEPYYDKVDLYLGISGHEEKLPYLPDSKFQRAYRMNRGEILFREAMAKQGRVATPYRAGVTTDGLKHNSYRSKCLGRGACNRHVGGCDIHAAFDSPTGLIAPAMDTGHLSIRTNSTVYEVTVDKNTGKATGVSFIDTDTGKVYQAKGKAVILGASTLESARLMLNSKSTLYPNGIGNSSGHVGHNFCEHVMGAGVTGIVRDLIGKPHMLEDGRPGGFYLARFRNLKEKSPNFLRGYGFEGESGQSMFPGHSSGMPGIGAAFKKEVRDYAPAMISMGGFGEVLARYENYVELDPEVKDRWGVPVLRFNYKFGENERAMVKDMVESAKQMFEDAGIQVVAVEDEIRTEGWSIHEMGTARMGTDPKKSVLNQFQQAHDVKNLLVVDGSSHVNAANQNPTWTIMALCWRSCDNLADQMRKGEV